MEKRGLPKGRIQKIMGENWMSLLRAVWGQ
jgi:microsomal dipeptidase-like Zn-dependent dipeptidase